LFAESAQVFFNKNQIFKKNYYSFPRNDLSSFPGIPKTRFFAEIVQVRPNYGGASLGLLPMARTLGAPGKDEQ
jgi:hypothetical protein